MNTTALSSSGRVVYDRLSDKISSGKLENGERLASERSLAVEMKVSQAAVQAALRKLQAEGMIRSVSPRIRVVEQIPSRSLNLLQNTVVIPTKIQLPSVDNPRPQNVMGHRLLLGATRAAQLRGWNTLTLTPRTLKDDTLHSLIRETPRGVILIGGLSMEKQFAEKTILTLREAGIAVTAYGDDFTPRMLDRLPCDIVRSDPISGGRELVQFFIEKGCRQFALLWDEKSSADPTLTWLQERTKGCVKACLDAGLPEPIRIPFKLSFYNFVPPEEFEVQVRTAAGYLLEYMQDEEQPDCLLCLSDIGVFSVPAALNMLGKKPGQDIMIGGYDNYWEETPLRNLHPTTPQATIDKNNHEIGEMLVTLLADRISGKLPAEMQRLKVSPKLITT